MQIEYKDNDIKTLAKRYLKGVRVYWKELRRIKEEIMEDISGDLEIEEAKKKILRNERRREYIN